MNIRGGQASRQRGQTLIIAVLSMGVLMALTAMAIDAGLFYEDRRHWYGGGSNEYRNNIVDGVVDSLYCIQDDPSPACTGSETVVDALSGNKVGGTGQGIEDRWAAGAQCDTTGNSIDDFNEVFTPTGQVSPAYTVSCPDSPWLIIIPIITYESVPIQTVTIRGWTLAYLSSYACVVGNTVL